MSRDISHIKVTDIAGRLAKSFIYSPLTAVLAIFLLALGYLALQITPREEDPQIAISGGSVIVALPGASPQEVENVIIKPLERKLREISGVEHIYGIATDNVGIVNVMYHIGENREDSNLKLYDKVMQNMDLLPKGASEPLLKPFDIDIDVPIVTLAFYAKDDRVSQSELFNIVRGVQYELNSIENVSKTTLVGERREQFNVQVDLFKLSGYNLSMGQIMGSLKALAANVPDVKADVADGSITVFGIRNAIESVDDVKNVIVASYMGSPIYLKDVATVTLGSDIQNKQEAQLSRLIDDKLSNPQSQITLNISKLKGTNAVTVSESLVQRLDELKDELSAKGVGYILTRDYGVRADEAVNELVSHLLITIIIIAIVLVIALGWRESLIVTFTVPAILAITLFVAYLTDQTINRITLFAFLLSLGLLVDAAIIVIENIHRHLHSHDAIDKPKDEIMIEATDEIGAPTNVATVAIILTMVPMAFVGGMMGEFMKPIPYNVPVALFASLAVAYIFTPYLANKMLKKPKMHHHQHSAKSDKELS